MSSNPQDLKAHWAYACITHKPTKKQGLTAEVLSNGTFVEVQL